MLKTYWEAFAGFRRSGAICIALLVISGLAEAFAIASLLPLLSGNLSSKAGGQAEWFGLSGDTLTLAAVGSLVGLGLVAAFTRYLGESRSFTVAVTLEHSLRARMVSAFMGMRWISYLGVVVGDGIKSVTVETTQIGAGAVAIVQAVGNAAIAVVFVAVAAVVSPLMTGAVLVFGALTALLYRHVGRRSESLSRELSAQAGLMAETTTDLLTNAKFYRSVGLEDRLVARLDTHFAAWACHNGRVMRYLPTARLGSEAAGALFIGIVLAVTLVALGDPVAGPLVFLALFYRLAPRLQQTQQYFLQACTQLSWWRTWKQQYDTACAEVEQQHGTAEFESIPSIEFDAVSVAFPGRPVPALSDVSFTIVPGECLGVVGESGGGKTTLLDAVTGLLQPTAGAVRLDGVDLTDVDLRAWRSHIGLVMQDAPVFHTTILENIAWGDPAPDAERAVHAMEMANLADVIAGLPAGLDTEVGQKGGRFSGGQRQRLALARALYRDPWLLILDEATSVLDAESEQVIQEALASLRGSCSMLVVAHRLKTVQIADRILVLNKGVAVQSGTWSELLVADGPFRRQALAQGLGAEPAGATRP